MGGALTYFSDEAEGSAADGDEELQTIEAAASCALGPGIMMIGSVGWNDFDDDDDDGTDVSNVGYWVVIGIKHNL